MSVVGLPDEFQRRAEHVGVVPTDTADEPVGVTGLNHLSRKIRPTLEQASGVGPGDAFALSSLEKGVRVIGFAPLVVAWIIGFVGEVQSEFVHHTVNTVDGAKQNGRADALLDELGGCSKHRLVVALREDDALALALDLVDHLPHDGVGLAESRLELFSVTVDVEFLGRHAGDAFVNGGLSHCGGLPNQHPAVKGFGNDVFGTVLHDDAVVGR